MLKPKSLAQTVGSGGEGRQEEAESRDAHRRGLLLVGLFKLSKAIFFTAVGAVALHLVNRDIGDMVLRWTRNLPVDPDGHFVGLLMAKANLINNHSLRQAGLLSFGYALCCLVEGVGLIRQKVWAEYFTLFLTVAALPYELFEIARRFSGFKVGFFMLNVAVLIYLVWLLRRKWEHERKSQAEGNRS